MTSYNALRAFGFFIGAVIAWAIYALPIWIVLSAIDAKGSYLDCFVVVALVDATVRAFKSFKGE